MRRHAFISYRRSDSAQAVQGLWFQLRNRFGHSGVFMDVSGIEGGSKWTDRLRAELSRAHIVLAIIGPRWLTAADDYGRRRLDLKDDWVRKELLHAIDQGTPILPVLVAGGTLPDKEGLPSKLLPLLAHEAEELRDNSWDRDVNSLAGLLIREYGFIDNQENVPPPRGPRVDIAPLTIEQIDAALAAGVDGDIGLDEGTGVWEPVESMVPAEYPKVRQELRKAYHFGSFAKAVAFMSQAAKGPIRDAKHHPRWENQWKTVTVYLSTWDIGNRISQIDVDLAKALDHLYAQTRTP